MADPSAKLRVCAYARVSTDKDDQANSLENQTAFFTRYISENPAWEFVGAYPDEGITGTNTRKRDAFKRMMANARAGLIDLILTKEVSRFARNTVDTLNYARELRGRGIGILFILDHLDTRKPEDDFRLGIMAGVAQEESRKTSERVKWGQKRQMEKGVVFGRDLVGYTVKNGRLTVNPEEAEIVKQVYHMYLHEEKGSHVIARELSEAGISAKRVKRWSNTAILRMLRNEKYAGDLFQQKTYTPDYLDHKKKCNRGQREMIRLYDHHEAIIDRETWNAVQKEVARRSPGNVRSPRHAQRYWCSGKLKCGECGSTLVRRVKKTGYGQYIAWRCYQSAAYGAPREDEAGKQIGCCGEAVNDKALLYCAKHAIQQIPVNHDRVARALMRDIRDVLFSNRQIDTASFEMAIDALKSEKARIVRQAARGLLSDDDIKTAIAACDEEISVNRKQIELANSQNTLLKEQADGISGYIDEINEILKMESDGEAVCRELIELVHVFNGGVAVFHLKRVPFGIRLQYRTGGRGGRYVVQVIDVSFTEPLDQLQSI